MPQLDPDTCPHCGSDDVSQWAADGESATADQYECRACGRGGPIIYAVSMIGETLRVELLPDRATLGPGWKVARVLSSDAPSYPVGSAVHVPENRLGR